MTHFRHHASLCFGMCLAVGTFVASANSKAQGLPPVTVTTKADSGSMESAERAARRRSMPHQRSGDGQGGDALEEIVVTGSHIRGAVPAAPVIVIDEVDIQRSGYVAIGDVFRSLPQNFAGGNNPQVNVANTPTSGNLNYSGGSTPNLRGLGPGSTLTLINGHRLGYDGLGGAVDISLIPLDALERIEVVMDGSSAVYGSDAIAGVVNFITRKDYTGARSTASIGSATQGGGLDRRFSQMFGHAWNEGGAMLVYERQKQDEVRSDDRRFTATVPVPTDLLPGASRDSIFVSGNHRWSERVSASVDALYTSRDHAFLATPPGWSALITESSVEQYAAAMTVASDLGSEWRAALSTSAAAERNRASSSNFLSGQKIKLIDSLYRGKTQAIELTADGPMIELGRSAVRAAVGGGYRVDSLDWENVTAATANLNADRRVSYAFGELSVPILSDSIGFKRLLLTASGRYEDHSDVGGKFVPKFGVVYEPTDAVAVTSTWGKAFRAPNFTSLHSGTSAILLDISDPLSPTGTSQSLMVDGSNPALRPETATSWTLGLEYRPHWADGNARLNATYFDLKYKDRVAGFNRPEVALTDPVNAPLVVRNPSLEMQQALLAHVNRSFENHSSGPYDPASLAVLIDGRSRNISRQALRGVDVTADYQWATSIGNVQAYLGGSYLELYRQIMPTTANERLSGRAFNPPEYRARGGITWINGPWSTTAGVNWIDSFVNSYVPGSPPVASWTTVDLQIAFSPADSEILRGWKAALSIQNALDKDPPYLKSADILATGFNYDSLNTSPLGRFVTLQVTKEWGSAGRSE